MRRISGKPTPQRIFECPQCKKRRMRRPLDHVVSFEKQNFDAKGGKTIELYVDICENCKQNNFRKFFEPSRDEIKNALKAIHSNSELEGEESLEDLL